MPESAPEPSSTSEPPSSHDGPAETTRHEHDDSALKETVEKAASAYFSACRKLARAISHLKS